ncbi:MAG: A24 family peptidase [Rhizomicrobium sp.]
MIAQSLVIAVLPAMLALAAGFDLASFTIPNFLTLALVALFAPLGLALAMPLSAVSWHLLAGGVGLAAGLALFALGYIGGGDAKLFAAISLWLGWHDWLSFVLAASLLGGALAILLISVRQVPLPSALIRCNWILRLYDKDAGIPYGVALAAGALLILPHTEILRLAAVQ